ncbi:unnamed protein product [Rhizophagus irregularis]|nr:unnamed protein product [Rhizophagus irregularis]
MLGNIKTFAIFPALNVARVRNSDEYYVSSEIPGVYVGNRNGRVKLQVAGFRIYGYDENGKNLGEIKLQKGVEITWTVVLANKKAAHQGFDGMYHNHKSVRNAGWPYNRSTLENFKEFKVRVYRKNIKDDNPEDGGKLWVLVAPPKYAPGIPNIVSLYQIILETQHPVDQNYPANDPKIMMRVQRNRFIHFLNHDPLSCMKMKVHYYRDIRPIFEAIYSELEKKLCTPPGKDEDNYKDLRISILFCVQIPKDPATKFERNGQTYDYFMPSIFGDGGNASSGDLDTYLILTRGQYYLLQKWANGDFIKESNIQNEFKYKFNNMKFFNKAALEWCVGDAFYPGIEMTYLAYEKDTFKDASNESEHDFRINSDVIQPGDINAYMALPWQANFNECVTNWWPAQRPDIVIPKEKYTKIGDRE